MKKRLALLLAAAFLVSLTACGGSSAGEKNAIESKGVFVFSPKESFDLSNEEELSENETYLIHIYDIMPDQNKNADMSSDQEDYIVTLNGTNTYESITASSGAAMTSFTYASHYVMDQKIGTVFAGSAPIRAISVFRINKNDINDHTTMTFKIAGSDIYNSSISFEAEDIVTIDMLDKIFHIEEDPSQYQLASTMLWRSQGIKNAVSYLSGNGGLHNSAAVSQTLIALDINMMLNISAGLDSHAEIVYYDFDTDSMLEDVSEVTNDDRLELAELVSAVNATYPEITDATEALFAAKNIFTENLRLCSDPETYTEEALQQVNLAMGEIDASVNEIYTFFTA